MKKAAVLLTGLLLVCIVIGGSLLPKKRNSAAFQFGEFAISETGILSIEGQSAQYMMVPRDKFPAQLRGVAVIDIAEKVYVARFFEPGGVGVEGFFDVCFQLKNGKILASRIENAGSLERINGSTYVKSCSYVFDSEKRVLLKTDSADTKPTGISLVDSLRLYYESAK
jgi:hypothetical protein